jgi:hypothetical protein
MTRRPRERAWSGKLRWTWLHTAAAAWTVGGLLLWYANPWLWERLWAGSLAVWGAYVLLGAAIAFACLWAGLWRGWSRVTAGGLLLLGALVVGEAGPRIGDAAAARDFESRFLQMAPRYERVVKELAPRRQVPARGSSYGVDFVVDAGPPRRIAFPQPGSVTDNWEGVIYDPSDSLARAKGWRHSAEGVSATPVELVRLFGGTLLSCEPIRGHFYRCWFT